MSDDFKPVGERLLELPRWAVVVYATRCARYAIRLLEKRVSIPESWNAEQAVSEAEKAATIAGKPGEGLESACIQLAREAVFVARAAAASASMDAGCDGADYDGRDTDQQVYWQATAGFAAAAHSAVCNAYAAIGSGPYRSSFPRHLLADLDALEALTKEKKWSDKSGISPDIFGPLRA